MEQHTASAQSQVASTRSGASQADLVRASVLGSHKFPHGRRYGLDRDRVATVRTRVHDAAVEASTHDGATVESIATAAALEFERAIFYVGVERVDV